MKRGIKVKGMEQWEAKLEQVEKDLGRHGEVGEALVDATMLVARTAKQLAPVDLGDLRADIQPDVRKVRSGLEGVVGNIKKHAPFMEEGTEPHWPPLAALEVWARRHGTTAWVVCRAIGTRGNKAIKYLERGLTNNTAKIYLLLGRAVSALVRK